MHITHLRFGATVRPAFQANRERSNLARLTKRAIYGKIAPRLCLN
jgi:hypothetical protein